MKQLSRTAAITKDNLKTAFWQLYKQKGHGKVTVKEVAELAGYHRGVFYDYFANTDEVLQEIEEEMLAELRLISAAIDLSTDIPTLFIQQMSATYEKRSEYLYTLLSPQGDPHFRQRVKDQIKATLKRKLNLSGHNSLQFDISCEFISVAMLAGFCRWYPQRDQLSAEELLTLLHTLLRQNALQVLHNL